VPTCREAGVLGVMGGVVGTLQATEAIKYILGLGSKENAFNFINNLKMILNITNIGDTKTLIIHPDSTICASNTEKEKQQMGVFDDMLRLSVGIEGIDDIIEDIEGALQFIN